MYRCVVCYTSSSILKIKEKRSSETPVKSYPTILCPIPKDSYLYANIRSCMVP
jgi:hypothetical protein